VLNPAPSPDGKGAQKSNLPSIVDPEFAVTGIEELLSI
jgi:hypothetical protein